MSRSITFKDSFHSSHNDNETPALAPCCTLSPFEMWRKPNSPGWPHPHPHPPKCWDDRLELWLSISLPLRICFLGVYCGRVAACPPSKPAILQEQTLEISHPFPASTDPNGFHFPDADHGHLAGGICVFSWSPSLSQGPPGSSTFVSETMLAFRWPFLCLFYP